MLDPYVPAFKAGSGEIDWIEALERMARFNKPVLMATGASTIGEVQRAVNSILAINPQLVLLQCNTNYTASPENFDHIHLRVINTYRTMFPDVILAEGLWAKYDLVQDKEYPQFDYCYCETCRNKFQKLEGIDPLKIKEPSVCKGCGAVYTGGRWTWNDAIEEASEVHCPACMRTADNYPAGRIKLSGLFYQDHREEILNLIQNVE